MNNEITFDTRHELRRDTEANWNSSSPIPASGEPIVYLPDASHSYPRLKIGDGSTAAPNLPFITDEMARMIANTYSSGASYSVGSLCWHDGILYRCRVAISGGEAWNASHWLITTVATELASLEYGSISASHISDDDYALVISFN